ncbi:hypothetical protein CARUB_v10002875mg [Capsella rubella]|uniref:Uncharacterized protein n=1 Tax=Capsella rubella TaxID=81985 RepID=R0H7T2_9BRAS|nr:uncharacterized protein LOC17883093 [Capsella rubella]EOA19613.1 hypothetical protein CARUB_v10002875mg [Capsella rubella]
MAEYLNQFGRQEMHPPLSAQAMGEHQPIGTSGLEGDKDPSQLPMELQVQYILGGQQQHFSTEQQKRQIIGQDRDEPQYCQPYHQSNYLSVVPMETQRQGNVVKNLSSQQQLEEQDNVPLMRMNQSTKPPQLTKEQQQPCEQPITLEELKQEMDPEIASLLCGLNTTAEEARLLASFGLVI